MSIYIFIFVYRILKSIYTNIVALSLHDDDVVYGFMLCVFSAVPGAPSHLLVTNPSLDSLTLEWSPPHDRNGRITGYTLKYQPGENSLL